MYIYYYIRQGISLLISSFLDLVILYIYIEHLKICIVLGRCPLGFYCIVVFYCNLG